jgi:ERCC4-type nuclease
LREKVQADYGVDFEVNRRLLSVFGTVESAVIQTYHELNTIFLMEKINNKIRAKFN